MTELTKKVVIQNKQELALPDVDDSINKLF